MSTRKIAVLTSGGDCCGMNAALYDIYKLSKKYKFELCFVLNGLKGLLDDTFIDVSYNHETDSKLKDYSKKGGTFIYSARVKNFIEESVQKEAVKTLKKHKITDLIVIGGNGSFKAALALSKLGLNVYGIPATIDNDLFYTEFTLGFLSSFIHNLDYIDTLRVTMRSHHRLALVEVMGNKCGELAAFSSYYGDGDICFVNELNNSVDDIIKFINKKSEKSILIVSESVMHSSKLLELIKDKVDIEVKDCNLGHLQRGGNNEMEDLYLANEFVNETFKNLLNEDSGKCVGIKGCDDKFKGEVFSIDINKIDSFTNHNYSELINRVYQKVKETNEAK